MPLIGKIVILVLKSIAGVAMRTWQRYLLFQLPGWIIAIVVFALVRHWNLLAEWLALLGLAAWVIKDLALYPFVRLAYETRTPTGAQILLGAKGVVEQELSPEGYVRVRGELWRAVARPEEETISSGTPVEIVDVDRMTILVRPVPESNRR